MKSYSEYTDGTYNTISSGKNLIISFIREEFDHHLWLQTAINWLQESNSIIAVVSFESWFSFRNMPRFLSIKTLHGPNSRRSVRRTGILHSPAPLSQVASGLHGVLKGKNPGWKMVPHPSCSLRGAII